MFEDNLYAGAVNGPLWSLPVEVFAYLLLFLLGLTGLLARRAIVTAVAVAGLAWAAVWVPLTSDAVGSTYVIAAFAVGAAAYTFADRIVLAWPVALLLLPVCVAAGLGPASVRVVVWTLAAVYLSYWFAYAIPPVGRVVSRFGDASYGVYIWAFPIQQVLVQEIPALEPWGRDRAGDADRAGAGVRVVAHRRTAVAAPQAEAQGGAGHRFRAAARLLTASTSASSSEWRRSASEASSPVA